jgi:DNA-binding CsgD family transcriptional regulator
MRDEAASVIGRDEELDSIQAFLDEIDQGPTALLISGEAGIGKTVLWEEGVGRAQERVEHVLVHRSVEAEALLSFTGLSDLVAPILDEVASSLAPLRRRALEVALLLAEPGREPPDPRVIGFALLDVLQALAESGPVVIALDDVQWLDPSSAGVLQIALRRLGDERVGLVATLRKVPGAAAPFELENAFADERLERLWLRPLSMATLHHLLKERLGLDLTRPELARIQETSGGNPFFALELGREMVRTETRPAAGRTLRVPENLRELVVGRLARLPAETVDVLLSAAALARPTVELVAAAHTEPDEAVQALDEAVREGLVSIDGSQLHFANPLLSSICYEQASPSQRRAVHRALAGAVSDVEERARHLALAADAPDSGVASELEAAAEHAAARGATAAAAELCELAARLTPGDPAAGRQRRLRAANFHRLAGDRKRAATMLEELLSEVPHGVERSDLLYELAWTRRDNHLKIMELCDQALAEAGDDNARVARILSWRSWTRLTSVDAGAGLVDARGALEKAERVGDPKLIAVAIARVGQMATWVGDPTREILERGVEIEAREGLELEYLESPRVALARDLMGAGELDRARGIMEQLDAEAEARGDEGTRTQIMWVLTHLEWLAGRWRLALDRAKEALELSEQVQDQTTRAFAGRFKSLIEADLGLVEEARASADEALAISTELSNDVFVIATFANLGRLEFLLGNLDAAAGYLRELPARLLAGTVNDPVPPVWADTIETLIALGELESAGTYLEPYEANAEHLGSPCALAGASRCRGLLAAAEGDLEAAIEAHRHGIAVLEGMPYPLERGRTLLCLGSAHRQAKQKRAARDALEAALGIFDELKGPLWAEKARAELRRISGRRRASEEELTEMEERVARLAAVGRSNKEIAAELFVSVHTVGAHLSRAYRKLGIKSRSELAGRLAAPTGGGTTANPAK